MSDAPDDFYSVLKNGLACRCPQCRKGDIFKNGFLEFDLKERCAECGLDLTRNDSADGPAVFLMFVIGFLIVPPALILDAMLHPPLWLQAVLWGAVIVGLILLTLKPLKSYVIALQYRHRPRDWDV